MSILTWTNLNSGFWDDSNNWLDGIVPQNNPEDDVLIDVVGEINTTHNRGDTVVRNFTSAEKFNLREGSLTVENATLNDTFTLGSSNYASDKPHFIVNGVAELNGNSYLWDGTLTGIFDNDGLLTIEDSVVEFRDATLNNHNTIIQKNLSLVYLYSSEINNLADSVYEIKGGSLLTRVPNENSIFSLSNSTLEKSTTDTGTIDVQVNSNNGKILVKNGTLKFTEGGEIFDSEIIIDRDGIIVLGEDSGDHGDRTYRLNNTTISGNGVLEIGSQLYAEDTVTFGDRTTLLTFGTLQGDTFINPATGRFSIEGLASDTTRELEANLVNLGTIEHKAPGLFFKSGTLTNEGLYKLHGSTYGLPQALEGGLADDLIIYDVTIDAGYSADLDGHLSTNNFYGDRLINTGTIRNIQGYGDYSEIAVSVEDNNGIIEAAYGTLALSGDNSTYQETEFITTNYFDDEGNSQPSIIRFNGGSHLFRDNVSFENNLGNIQFGGSGTKIEVENTLDFYNEIIWGELVGFSFLRGTDTDSKIVNHGTFRIATGQAIPPELTGGIPVFLDEYYEHTVELKLVNEVGATIEHSRGYIYLELTESGKIDNHGTYNFLVEDGAEIKVIFNDQTYHLDSNLGGSRVLGDGEINNWSTGLFTKTGSKAGNIETVFNNYGTVDVKTGDLRFYGGGKNENGTYLISENTQLNFTDNRFEFTNTEIVNNGRLNFHWGHYVINDQLFLRGEILWRDDAFGTQFSGEGTVINQGNLTLDENGVRYEIGVKEFINENNLLIAGGRVYLSNQLTNIEEATITLGDGNPTITELNPQTENKLVNQGVLQTTDGSRSTLEVFLENNGLLDIQSGKLALSGGSFNTNSQIQIASGATLEITGEKGFLDGDTNKFQATTFDNKGLILIGRGTYSDAIALEALDDLMISGETTWEGGTIAGIGSVTNTGTFTINGLTYLESTLNNSNSMVMEGGTLWFKGGTLNNQTDAEFEMEGGEIKVWSSLRDSSSFNNAGIFRKTKNNNLTVGVAFNNSGTLEVAAGKLTLTEGGNQRGLIKIDQNATLVLDDGTEDLPFTFTGGSSIDNEGTLRIAAKIVTETNRLIFNGNNILDFSGELEGIGYRNEGKFTITGGRIESDFQNQGEVKLLGYNEVTLVNATLENSEQGTFDFGQGEITASSSENSSFINKGIFNKLDTGTSDVEVDFVNDGGELNIQQGTLLFKEEFTQTSGTLHLNNSSVSSWNVLNFVGGFVTGEGTISSSYNPVEFDAANINIGLADGDVGTIKIKGDYVESDNTTHYIDIKSSSQFDQLVIEKINSSTSDSGNAHLGGRYEIRVDETFQNQLSVGDRFEIVQFESQTLDNDGIELINTEIGNGLRFEAELNYNSLDLVVVSSDGDNLNNSAEAIYPIANNSEILDFCFGQCIEY